MSMSRPIAGRRPRNDLWHGLLLIICLALVSLYIQLQKFMPSFANNNNNSLFDSGPPVPVLPPEMQRTLAFDMAQLQTSERFAHGIFFFGPHSQEVIDLIPNYDPKFNSIQMELLDDDKIDIEKEKERCARYGLEILNQTEPKRRRLFLGAILGDDSMEVLQAIGAEVYNLFHTVSFVEGNTAHNLAPRNWRYYDPNTPSEKLNTLYQLYGPKTKVSVDYYNTTVTNLNGHELLMDYLQREGNTLRWRLNGMRDDDIAIMRDADEIFTRDFLRAMQICDIAEFRPDQNCKAPKVIANTVVFESSPNCPTKDRRWHHPDALLGKCIEHTGDSILHPPAKRQYAEKHGLRLFGYGYDGEDYSQYIADNSLPNTTYPLWHGTDMRLGNGGRQIAMIDGSPSGFHFHNFFLNADEVRYKYATYGHAKSAVMEKPVWEASPDVQLAVDCAHDKRDEVIMFNGVGSVLPIYYLNDDARNARHQLWQSIVRVEEERWINRTDLLNQLQSGN